jgi:hypothetical protein
MSRVFFSASSFIKALFVEFEVVIGRNPSLAYEKCYELPTQPNLIHFKITLRQTWSLCDAGNAGPAH